MKKSIATVCLFVAVSLTSFSQMGGNNSNNNGTNYNQVLGLANAAIRQNCPEATGYLTSTITIVSTCTNGTVKTVVFTKAGTGNQSPNFTGSVTLDCDNNVIAVSCLSYSY